MYDRLYTCIASFRRGALYLVHSSICNYHRRDTTWLTCARKFDPVPWTVRCKLTPLNVLEVLFTMWQQDGCSWYMYCWQNVHHTVFLPTCQGSIQPSIWYASLFKPQTVESMGMHFINQTYLGCCKQAHGKQVVAAQLDTADASEWDKIASLDPSAAHVLLLGCTELRPQPRVLWLQLDWSTSDCAASWLQQSPQLVVLVARHLQVRHTYTPLTCRICTDVADG
jgi:hypothetical protein